MGAGAGGAVNHACQGLVRSASSSVPSRGCTVSPGRAPSGSGPGVVVIQEWWGLVPHIRDVADRLAAQGFVAVAPDLYRGKETTEPDEAGKLMMSLNVEQAAGRLLVEPERGEGYDDCQAGLTCSNGACTPICEVQDAGGCDEVASGAPVFPRWLR